MYKSDGGGPFKVDANGVAYNNSILNITDDGTLEIYNPSSLIFDNQTDDMYTYVNLNMVFTNDNSDYISIKNITTNEETIISGMSVNEVITLSAEQFILSSVPNKIFGSNFNFVWPRLIPGINEFVINGSGSGSLEFTYRYPIKIGDCAIDVDIEADSIAGNEQIISGYTGNTIEFGNKHAFEIQNSAGTLFNIDDGTNATVFINGTSYSATVSSDLDGKYIICDNNYALWQINPDQNVAFITTESGSYTVSVFIK